MPTSTNMHPDRYVAIDSRREHNCTLRANGIVHCWGGHLRELFEVPEGRYRDVSAGGKHSCAIRRDSGELVCWGAEQNAPDGAFASVSAGYLHACALRATGEITCWGNRSEDRNAAPEGAFTQVSVGTTHACALRSTGTVVCGGNNQDGQTATQTGTFTAVAAGQQHTCGLRSSGAIVFVGARALARTFPAVPTPPSAPAQGSRAGGRPTGQSPAGA